jgi:aryl-alcohol dehydrogenase-like predicted oxidoreductase
VKQLYAYLAHDAQAIINNVEIWRELQDIRGTGSVGRIGFSLYSPGQLKHLLDLDIIPDVVQLPYNLFDRRFESEFKMLKSLGIEIHTRSAFLQGLFFVKPEELPDYFDSAKPILKKMQAIHKDNSLLAATCLNFCVNNPFIDIVVIGINNTTQLSANLSGLMTALPEVEYDDFILNDESILLPYLWPKKSS